MNKFLACFLLIAVLASAQCSIFELLKEGARYIWDQISKLDLQSMVKLANDYIEKNPTLKNIKNQLIQEGKGTAFNLCSSLKLGDIYCLKLINEAKKYI